MTSVLAFLLESVSLGRLCFLYFFLAPVFLPREDPFTEGIVFGIGYLFSMGITGLAAVERLFAFAENVSFRKHTPIILALIAACFITIAINTPGKLLTPGEYYFKYFKLIFPVLAFFIMVNIWTYRDLPKLYALLMVMVLITIFALIPEGIDFLLHPAGTPRFGSFLKEPNKYALLINILYGMTLPNMIDLRLKRQRVGLLLFLSLVLVIVLFMTQSRGGIFIWAVVTGIAFWPRPARAMFFKALPFLAIAGALFAVAIVLRYLNKEMSANASDLGRLWTYMVGFQIISQRPFTGIGYANVITYCDQFGGVYKLLLGKGMAIHNTTLEVWAEEGFFGMVFYLCLVFAPVVVLFRRLKARAATGQYPALEVSAICIPIAFFCFGLFCPNYLADDYFWAYMSFTFIVLRSPAPEDFSFGLPKFRWV
jgi:O-antigen ligase